MTTLVHPKPRPSFLPPVLALLLCASLAHGQAVAPATAAAPKPEEVLVLSPFVVTSEQDTGYAATDTLAGTRLRTNLGDLATSIQVVTKSLLQDTGSTNARDILVYTTSTEVAGSGGNFAAASTNATGSTNERANFRVPQTRIRGLAGADLTRDFFSTSIPFDAYNTDRVEINRGANAALFGLGSPAGIINNSLALAQQRNFGSASVQIGSYGSHRETFDLNMAPGAGLAVRAAGVYDDEKFRQMPAFARERRGYLAALWEPAFLQKKGILSGSAVRANYESGRRNSNSPRTMTPGENISRWFSLGKPTWDPPTSNLTTADRNIFSHTLTFTLATLWPDPNRPVPGQGTVGIVNPSRPPSATTGLPIFATYGALTRLRQHLDRIGGDPFILAPALSNSNVFDFRHYMLDGPNKHEFIDFNVFNASVEFRLLKDTLGVEAAYNREDFKSGAVDWLPGGWTDGEFIIDFNLRMFDGTPNPNYGRPYFDSKSVTDFSLTERETKRATAYYNFDTRDLVGERWGAWLGKHTLTFAATEQSGRVFNKAGSTYIPDMEMLKYQGVAGGSTGVSPMITYVGPSVVNLASLSQVRLQPVTVVMRPDRLTAAQSRFIVWNPATNRWENQPVQIYRQEPETMEFASGGGRSRDRVRSQVAVWQSTFMHDTVVFTGSWRKDKLDAYAAANAPRGSRGQRLLDETNFPLPSAPTLAAEAETTAYGVVGKVPRRFTDRLPGVSGLGVFFNTSSNFQPGGARVDAYGAPIAPPSGTTKDYGAMLGLLGGKLNLRATWFETKQVDVSAGMSTVIAFVARLEARVLSRIREGIPAAQLQTKSPGITQAEVDRQVALWLASPFPYANRYFVNPNPPAGQVVEVTMPPGTEDTLDLVSKGLELEATYNPLPNWRITFNVAKQRALQSNTGTTALRFIQERLPLWERTPNLPTTEAYSDSVQSESRAQILAQYYRIANLDGTLRPEVREWRFNVITNYDFERDLLKGWGVGGAYRWEDKAGVGYQTFFDPTLSIWRIDPTKPWYSPAQDHLDGWVSYRRKINDNRIVWKTQLNIRNLPGKDALVTTYRNPDGTPALFAIPEGRRWELSTRFEF